MGTYVNPGNSGFSLVLRGEYVDKTEMITLLNQSIDTPRMLICVSRPRRFGKSYAAKMLCAYYDCSCDSHALFDGRAVSRTEGYEDYMNQFNVISLDITSFVSRAKRMGEPLREVTNYIVEAVREDLIELDPSLSSEKDLINCLLRYVDGRGQGRKFIFVIDEWDALIREAVNDTEAQERFFNLLRELFKNNSFTPRGVAAAYITGILPIKKDGSQSAISDFIEYPILYPGAFARFTGFTEEEVRALCQKHEMDFSQMKAWYDGYDFAGTGSIYNPYSVISAVCNREYRSYWQKTSAIESLPTYIRLNYDGLQEIVARLITGEEIETDPDTFENDFVSFKNRDDVLTLLVHLGYLTWNKEEGTVRIPNEEVRIEFKKMLRDRSAESRWVELVRRSSKLLKDTIARDAAAVAAGIQAVRESEYAPTYYNDEQALRYVIKFAYVAAIDQYLKVEELPSGRGLADVVFIPKSRSVLPALVIELKWNKSSDGAIAQIRDRRYPSLLKEFGGKILLVGINYDDKTKEHTCVIEEYQVD